MDQAGLIYKIARAYYERGLTQQEIADRYGVSRIRVSRLLARAIRDNIVQITIARPGDTFSGLEHLLEEKFGLDEVIIVKGVTDNKKVVKGIGAAGAAYLASRLQGNEVVGLTWGKALYHMVDQLPVVHLPGVKVVQMLGGLGEPEAEYHGAELARRMAQAFGGRPRLIHSPAILSTPTLCQELKNDHQVVDTLRLASKADIALLGIGWFGDNAPLAKSDTILRENDITTLKQKKATGDISLRFFDQSGRYMETGLDDRIVGLTSKEIQKIPKRIGLAGGVEKWSSIRAAINGRLINVLVTDQRTAEKLAQEQ